MLLECFLAGFCDRIGRVCFSADKAFVHFYEAVLFEVGQMGSEVPVGEFEQLFEIVKGHFFVHQQDAHHSHADAAIECFI